MTNVLTGASLWSLCGVPTASFPTTCWQFLDHPLEYQSRWCSDGGDGDADGNDDGFDDDDYELWLNDAYNFARKLGKKKQRFRLWRQKFLSGLSAIGLDVEEVRKSNDKEKTFLSIIKFCLAICKLTNIPIFAIYIYGISHHVCLLIHVQCASLKHTWPPTKEGQSNKMPKAGSNDSLAFNFSATTLPAVQEVNSEGRNNVHFIKLHAPWPLLCRYTGRLLSGNVVPCTNALDHGLFCVVEVGS